MKYLIMISVLWPNAIEYFRTPVYENKEIVYFNSEKECRIAMINELPKIKDHYFSYGADIILVNCEKDL